MKLNLLLHPCSLVYRARWYTRACIFHQSSNKSATFSRVNFAIKGMEGVNIYITEEIRLPTREEIISTRFTNLEIRNIEIWIFLRFFLISFLYSPISVSINFQSSKKYARNALFSDYTQELNFIIAISGTSRSRDGRAKGCRDKEIKLKETRRWRSVSRQTDLVKENSQSFAFPTIDINSTTSNGVIVRYSTWNSSNSDSSRC